MPRQPSHHYDRHAEPFSWWGYRDAPEAPLSIVELIRRSALDARTAAFLWLAMEHDASIIVAAEPHSAGKTTILTAILDFLPVDRRRLYLRGWYERFDFLQDTDDPAGYYLLSNEISSYLPTYLWGRGVRQLFEAAHRGYAFASTVHAKDATSVLELLRRYPLDVPEQHLTAIDLVISLGMRDAGGARKTRRVMSIEMIGDQEGRPSLSTIVQRDVIGTELNSDPGRLISILVRAFGMSNASASGELARRERYLGRLVRDQVNNVSAVQSALAQYQRQHD